MLIWDRDASKPKRRVTEKGLQKHSPPWGCEKWATFVAERNEVRCQEELCDWKISLEGLRLLCLRKLEPWETLSLQGCDCLLKHLVQMDILCHSVMKLILPSLGAP